MNYILVMTLSGSAMLLIYFIQKHTFGKNLPRRWQYLFLKAVMIYYLVPLPWLGESYRKALKDIRKEPPQFFHQYFRNEKVVYQSGNNMMISAGYQRRLLEAGIGCLMVFLVFTVLLVGYLKNYRRMLQCRSGGQAAQEKESLEQKRLQWHIRRKITLCSIEAGTVAFTMGIWRPVIVCKMPEQSVDRDMLISHEMVHIKRFDLFWKMLGGVVLGMHWFNPLAYLFRREFEKVSEESCDELVVEGYTEEERFRYAHMLLEYAKGEGQMRGWKTGLSKNAGKIQERVELIMDYGKGRKKWTSLLAVLFMGIMAILNSMTALAYEEVKVLRVIEEEDMADIKTMNVETCFTPDDYEGENLWVDVILYSQQFEDEEGNIYPVEEEVVSYSECSHVYHVGIYKNHQLDGSGGCTIDYFEGQYCSNCGYCIIGEKVGSSSFKKCLH